MLLVTMVDRCSLYLGSSIFCMRPDCREGRGACDEVEGESNVALAGARPRYEEDSEAHPRGHDFPLSEKIIIKSPKESSLEGSACGACELRSNSSERQRASNPQAGHAFDTTSTRARRGEPHPARHGNDPRSAASQPPRRRRGAPAIRPILRSAQGSRRHAREGAVRRHATQVVLGGCHLPRRRAPPGLAGAGAFGAGVTVSGVDLALLWAPSVSCLCTQSR